MQKKIVVVIVIIGMLFMRDFSVLAASDEVKTGKVSKVDPNSLKPSVSIDYGDQHAELVNNWVQKSGAEDTFEAMGALYALVVRYTEYDNSLNRTIVFGGEEVQVYDLPTTERNKYISVEKFSESFNEMRIAMYTRGRIPLFCLGESYLLVGLYRRIEIPSYVLLCRLGNDLHALVVVVIDDLEYYIDPTLGAAAGEVGWPKFFLMSEHTFERTGYELMGKMEEDWQAHWNSRVVSEINSPEEVWLGMDVDQIISSNEGILETLKMGVGMVRLKRDFAERFGEYFPPAYPLIKEAGD